MKSPGETGGERIRISTPPVARHDLGVLGKKQHQLQYGSLRWLGIEDSPAFVGEPRCKGCAERFIRTPKEQVIWVRLYNTIDELSETIRTFMALYNTQWLIERHGHCTPREAYLPWTNEAAA